MKVATIERLLIAVYPVSESPKELGKNRLENYSKEVLKIVRSWVGGSRAWSHCLLLLDKTSHANKEKKRQVSHSGTRH